MRDTDLTTLVKALEARHTQRHDVVAPARAIQLASTGELVLREAVTTMTMDGVDTAEALTAHTLTTVAHGHLSDKLGVPLPYWQRMVQTAPGLLAENANHWLAKDARSFYVRTLRGGDDDSTTLPVCRAVLGDRFRPMDDFDVLLAALEGVTAAGVDARVTGGDLTERRMVVRMEAPEVTAAAPELLARYRNPGTGATGRDHPLVSAGLVITNSEVGHGSFTITPRLVVQVCKNGMTQAVDALRAVHVGGQLEAGVVDWSADTHQRNLELVKARTRDAVQTFLQVDYVRTALDRMAHLAEHRLTDPVAAIEVVAKGMGYTAEQRSAVLAAFVGGGDVTAMGVASAVTYVAQFLPDGDAAYELEAGALRAAEMALAAA
jgi:hypothetical protein